MNEADLLKKVLDAVKELVTDANFDCSDEGIKLQAMDNSHVALVSLNLVRSGFTQYRCDRDMSLGMSLTSLQKIVKCAANNDMVTLRADESQDVLALLFEAKHTDRVGEYEMKLMDIDQEHLGIPDTVYDAEIDLSSAEFARIIRDLKELGESVKIEVSKEGVRFSAEGDIGNASVTLKPTDKRGRAADESDEEEGSDDEEEGSDEEEEEKSDEEEEEAEEEEPKEEDEDVEIKDAEEEDKKPAINGSDAEAGSGDEDDAAVKKAGSESPQKKKRAAVPDSENEDDGEGEGEDGEPSAKKVKGEKGAKDVKKEKKDKAAEAKKEKERARKEKEKEKKRKEKEKAKAKKQKESEKKKAAAKKGKGKKEDGEKNSEVKINLQQAVTLTFSIKYLSNFAKSTPLSDRVQLHMSNEVPLLVQYSFDAGHVRYYLAPKIADE
ncbi:proliferating cell nuclear antigen [Rhodotorula kratochvilovae]